MPDAPYISGGSSRSATRAQLDAEKADMRAPLTLAISCATTLIEMLKEMAEDRLYADEKTESLQIAKDICGAICDGLDEFMSPLRKRADGAGIDPACYDAEKDELEALWLKLDGLLAKRAGIGDL